MPSIIQSAPAGKSSAGPSFPAGSPPIFLLSFRQRDELARMAERAGWATIAARRADGLERRFLGCGASVALIDARDALADGLAAVRGLADVVQANSAALLVLLPRREASILTAAFEAGATHYLSEPFTEGEFGQSLRFAARHAERLAGGHRAAAGRARMVAEEAMLWRWSSAEPRRVALSSALALAAGYPEAPRDVTRGEALRLLGRPGMRAALSAIARLRTNGGIAPFAHNGVDGRRLAHHLLVEEGETGESSTLVIGHVEPIDGARAAVDASPRDPLTGLEDGHGARRWIEARLARSSGDGTPLVLAVVGISRFYMINEAFGRAVGDAIIRSVARRIERMAGRGAARAWLVARLAGAQFAIGIPAPTTLAEAEMLAANLVEAVGKPFVAGERVVSLSARVGIAAAEAGDKDATAVMRRAGLALADAENGEATRVRVFTSDEETRRAEDHRLELDLRLALDEDRIEVLWQPQVSVSTKRIVGVEALARWQHPVLGELGAEALFSAAERSDYLIQLSEHVQAKAIAAAATWPEALAGLRVAINVTSTDIAQPGFAAHLLARIDATGFSRKRLTVEITEGGLIEDLASAAALLAELRAGGVRVAIDDFGTGYSSLAYLKALPLDYLKIDRGLAQDIAGSARDRIVVRSVIDMGRSLGLAVIAEGVETEEQLTLLAREGCNYYQGFLCAPPLSTAALEKLVAG